MLSFLLKGEDDRDTRRFVFVCVWGGGRARIEGREGKSRGAGGGEGGERATLVSYRHSIQLLFVRSVSTSRFVRP